MEVSNQIIEVVDALAERFGMAKLEWLKERRMMWRYLQKV